MANKPAKQITYKGESLTVPQWSKKLGICETSLRMRIKKFEAGELTLDQAMNTEHRPNISQQPEAIKPGAGRKSGLRVVASKLFLEATLNEIAPFLADEFRTFRVTGEVGNAMKFYKDYAPYLIPRNNTEELDGEQSNNRASIAVVFNNNEKPADYTVLD